ncbi:MAG TPA: peptidylprolyl isomerase [Anaerolineaceae bacterium]|nr:peptidylprolyl isomerase [Anaerolineaceae bacterium]
MPKNPNQKVLTKKHQARLEKENTQRRYLLIGSIIVAVLVIGVIAYGILDQSVFQAMRPVAKVGNQTITLADFEKRVRFQRWQMIQQYNQELQFYQMFSSDPSMSSQFTSQLQSIQSQLDPTQASTLGGQVLDGMIDDLNIAQEAQKRGITVSDADVEKAEEANFNYYPSGTPTSTTTPTPITTSTLSALQLTLVGPSATPTATLPPTATATNTPGPTATNLPPTETATETPTATSVMAPQTPTPSSTPYTLQGYQQQLQTYVSQMKDFNFTANDIRQIVKASLLRTKLEDAITSDVKSSEDEVWARHILVADQATAEKVRALIVGGENFVTVAAQYSTDTGTKNNGGDLGWFGKGQMDPAFEAAAFALKVSEISQPVKSQYGWHIIQSLGHEVRALSATQIQSNKDTEFTNWLNTQRTAKDIQKFDIWMQNVPTDPTLSPANQVPTGQ